MHKNILLFYTILISISSVAQPQWRYSDTPRLIAKLTVETHNCEKIIELMLDRESESTRLLYASMNISTSIQSERIADAAAEISQRGFLERDALKDLLIKKCIK